MSRALIAIIGIGVVAMAMLGGVQAGLESAGDERTVANETFTPDTGNVTVLNESNVDGVYYDDTVTVYDENNTRMQAGTDYEWLDSNGTVRTLGGGDLDGDSSATITYGYSDPSDTQESLATLLAMLPQMLAFALPLLGFLLVLIMISG